MCNLYSITTSHEAIRALFRVINRYVGNLPPMPGVFPDYSTPVIRNTEAGTEMKLMRWACQRRHERVATGHEHPQHRVAALAHMTQAGEPMLGPSQQLCRIRR